MRVAQEEFTHPSQVSRYRLSVFQQEVGKDVPAADDALRGKTGFLVTEERIGSTVVFNTLGFFLDREEALACLRERAHELGSQRWQPAAAAVARPA